MSRRRGPAVRRLAGLALAVLVVGALLVPLGAGAAVRAVAVTAGSTAVTNDPSAGSPAGHPLAAAAAPELPHPPTGRRRGLPVAVAVVALLGAGSLVVRVLLAVPVRRRR